MPKSMTLIWPSREAHDVLGLEVAVDDRRPLRVGRVQGASELQGDVRGFGPGQGAALGEHLTQIPAVELLEDHDLLLLDLDAGQAADDVRIVDVGEDAHLAHKSAPALLAAGELRAQDLQGHGAVRQELFGGVDSGHTALTEEAADEVVAKAAGLAAARFEQIAGVGHGWPR